MNTDVVFWILNVVAKSGNAPFRHFQLNVDNSDAKFPLVSSQISHDPNHVFLNLRHD